MDRPDYELEQKEQMLKGIDIFFELYGNYTPDDYTYILLARCFWDSNAFLLPENYHLFREDGDLPLENSFEGRYRLTKASLKVMSGERIPLGYSTLLRFYHALFSSVLFRHQELHEGIAVGIKYVVNPQFTRDKKLLDYIYQDFDGLGSGITNVGMIRVHPLWSTHMFYEEVVFEGELDSLQNI